MQSMKIHIQKQETIRGAAISNANEMRNSVPMPAPMRPLLSMLILMPIPMLTLC